MFEKTKIIIILERLKFFIKQNHLSKKLLVFSKTIFDDFWMKHLTKNVRFSEFASISDSEYIF